MMLSRKRFLGAMATGAVGPFGHGPLRAQGSLQSESSGSLYPASFRLKPLSADRVRPVPQPVQRSSGLHTPSWVDPTYGTRVYKVTAASDFPDAEFVRHNYSRRQAFNADNTRFLAQSSNGSWLLYSAITFDRLKAGGRAGALSNMAGDAEALWHPSDPRKLWYTAINGGLVWWEKDVERDADTVMADFRGRLPWPSASAVWTKGEGTCSADGRFFAFMATSYDEVSKATKIYGIFSYDRVSDRIVGRLDAAAFGHAMPDHVSISPSGRFVVPSWDNQPKLGVRAYTLDFSNVRQLENNSEHSDLAIGPNGDDYYVHAGYKEGAVTARNLATGVRFHLMDLYPRRGASIGGVHISGQAFARPGWVVVSTYGESADYGKTTPDPVLQPAHSKVMLVELRAKGRQYNVAHTQVGSAYGGYFGEPQATVSRDGTRILFASNFNTGGPPSSYLILLPAQVYA